jgi:ribonuclease Z
MRTSWSSASAHDGLMSDRELVVLGTASQMPTRYRNHNGYLLLWDDEGVLVDPGEGTQRQFLFADVRVSRITRICLTHLHGDHCLGLPGVLARLAHARRGHTVHLHYPTSGQPYVERLLSCSVMDLALDLELHPVEDAGVVVDEPGFRLSTVPLDHRIPAMGWRVDAPARRHFVPDRLSDAGIDGPLVGRLGDEGRVEVDGRTVTIDEVSEWDDGQSVAFVLDTRRCDGALQLARGVDLLVCESTFLDADAELAQQWGHMTADQAGRLAVEAGARRLLLTHFSQRYDDPSRFLAEASTHFPDVVVAEDLMRVTVPRPERGTARAQ